jgi:heterodisulfide reductase subunit A-like polyferredoxin
LDQHGYASFSETYGLALNHLHSQESFGSLDFNFDPLLCTKCNQCVELCPYVARSLSGEKPKSLDLTQSVDEIRCRSCGFCVSVCRPGALSFGNWPRKPMSIEEIQLI